ncbi:flagellar protein FlhE [Pseudomonas savastanoi pv. phaseolicola]|nr:MULTISPECIES: flagellar protein FlhE [Pseudomonas]MDG6379942.1 flagellar protein FlhE [Pseudomonas savastanoi pv. phaseolicola]MDG6390303.1 flagellar protein FlhE [Pseudomonas savastanoi pv. phaseolicola]
MKFNDKKLKWNYSASGIALALLAYSNLALAGNYQSSVALPVIHSKGYMHTAALPVSRHVPPVATIKNVSWNWNVAGWPQGLEVYLCQGASVCLNVSRQRTGSTTFFGNQLASRTFYYTMKIGETGRVPVAGQQGRITVDW